MALSLLVDLKSINPIKIYRGEGAASHLIKELFRISKDIDQILKLNKQMIITDQQEKQFITAKDCHICEKRLYNDRVRDHCHITGQYRGASHSKCTVKM